MAGDFLHIEQAGEDVVLIGAAESAGFVAVQSTGSSGSKVGEHRHNSRPGPAMIVDDIPGLAIDTAVNVVDEAVTQAPGWELEEGGGEDALAAGGEDQIDGIIHAAGHDRLDAGAVGPGAEDVGCPRYQGLCSGPFVSLLRERSFTPVDPAVWPEIGPMQIVRTARECLALEPFDSLVGHAGALGVGQLPDARRRGHVQGSLVPHRSFGKHHLVGKHPGLVKLAIALGAFQANDAMRLLLELFGHLFVGAGGVGDIQPTLLVEIGRDGPIHQRRPRYQFDLEAHRQRERVPVELNLMDFCRRLLREAEPGGSA